MILNSKFQISLGLAFLTPARGLLPLGLFTWAAKRLPEWSLIADWCCPDNYSSGRSGMHTNFG